MKAFVQRAKALWGGAWWWWTPPVPFFAVALFHVIRGDARWEHFILCALVPALAYSALWAKKLCVGLLPIGFVGVVFDVMGQFQRVGLSESNVHLCDLRAIEMRFFGLGEGASRGTLHDYWQAHATPALDLFCAVPYGTFIFVALAASFFLYFKDYPKLLRFTWSFFLLNVMGFATYHLYPAAPPWYFHAHGCVVDVLAKASEGPNLMRVDHMLGISYFHGMYGRASDVFGAVPSLHVAYPAIITIFGWRSFNWPLRIASSLFYAWMCFSAVYLDHHWVIDILVGTTYAGIAVFVTGLVTRSTTKDKDDDAARANTSEASAA